ncbi:Uncharacterised protein [Mycobacteroides abscessus subsp. abscessus]|nr:Uncharacterised protein [Mycobacteroides abscessus subsp. abscessus]
MATDDAVTQPFTDAIAEAEKLVASAPHIAQWNRAFHQNGAG